MKASELRIGNLLEFTNGIQPSKIVAVGRRFFSSAAIEKEDGDFIITPYYKPIPLTEEWLLKFGFEITSLAMHTKYDKGEISLLTRNGSGIFLTYYQSTKVKYVHSIQNLYFALTGEELTINHG